jgi:hypothetical protein
MLLLNFGYWLFIKSKFGLQPFNAKYLAVLGVAGVSLVVGIYLPIIDNFFIDVFYRSGIVAAIYGSSIYFLKISEDINDLMDKVLMKKP